mmetsp:Transcript_11861/g.24944  ORF Transcript_11861/g.24944 Transcript_11861/m.24944 type:complete len:440 (-) Transcript_11861:235-1554(-)|eukprot:CAMPEP_0118929882 /NCGR_PEP_ID=MMETSP1169-20130426/6751_1 /TAXON_ID=36882 /ORGANISM="Pyramimonas obovata, Strain CCMP722" /LENGTH=439 /DNA_ID=CAMNT_0006872149 /DNA_START=117 /DNA_END=1436 /DNA_ORIENTATION=-
MSRALCARFARRTLHSLPRAPYDGLPVTTQPRPLVHGRSLSKADNSLSGTFSVQSTRFSTRARATAAASDDCVLEPWPTSNKPIEEAFTPPASWYTRSDVLRLEETNVFQRTWQCVGRVDQVANPGDYFTGSVLRTRFVVVRGSDNVVRGFHNVCRHHAAAVACGAGKADNFQCPYHGWTYALDGRLSKATRLAGIKNFKAKDYGLVPIQVEIWGSFVFAYLGGVTGEEATPPSVSEWFGEAGRVLVDAGAHDPLRHVRTKVYEVNCNWKVVCDNYLDGGYHVPIAHPALADGLDMASYRNTLLPNASLQTSAATDSGEDSSSRLGDAAVYAFVYPNIMINRYGPWMDTNIVFPITADRCRVVFDYFLDPSHPSASDPTWVESSLADSHQVQVEDTQLCEEVQMGLDSPAYGAGRYAPTVEGPMLHFHQQLHQSLTQEA